jgi:arginyl-tRNA synthetase
VHFDVLSSEQAIYDAGKVDQALALLADAGSATRPTARSGSAPPNSATTRTGSCEGDGSLTYLVPDIAYHMDKHDRGFDRAIDVWGADHHGYIPRMRPCSCPGLSARFLLGGAGAAGQGDPGGEEVKMSKRAGEFVTLRDLSRKSAWTPRATSS